MMQYSGGGGNICDTCGRGYRWSTGLSRHKRLECGKEAQFQCPHCTYRAKQKVNLFAHIRRKHPSDVPTKDTPKLQLIAPICHLLNWQNYLEHTKIPTHLSGTTYICPSIYFEVTKCITTIEAYHLTVQNVKGIKIVRVVYFKFGTEWIVIPLLSEI